MDSLVAPALLLGTFMTCALLLRYLNARLDVRGAHHAPPDHLDHAAQRTVNPAPLSGR